jgi:hypothetical protein
MPTLPALDKNVNHSPHLVILGAGSSLASFPKGDANGNGLPLMNSIVDILSLNKLLDDAGIKYSNKGFEELYSDLSLNSKFINITNLIEEKIYEYFFHMKLPPNPTIYDYLILSLREKDLIATFNWDPLLLQALRRNGKIKKPPQIAFLHGNVAVGCCSNCKILGFMYNKFCHKCLKPFSRMKLLYPVKQKDYSNDSVIKDQWTLFKHHLKHAYFLTIYGYSAPESDIDAKNIMLDIWKNNQTLKLAEVEIIDIKQEEELEEKWEDFFYSHHYSILKNIKQSYLWSHPRRSCDAFAAATLQCSPWPDNEFPKFKTINDLHDWLGPLIDDELKYENNKTPFSFKTQSMW